MLFIRNNIRQFLAFASVGVFGTAVQYIILTALVETINLDPVISTTIGYLAGTIVNYTLSYKIIFKSSKKHYDALTKFLIIAGIGLLINMLLMYLGTRIFSLHYLLVQIIATSIVLFWNYILNKFWTFAQSK